MTDVIKDLKAENADLKNCILKLIHQLLILQDINPKEGEELYLIPYNVKFLKGKESYFYPPKIEWQKPSLKIEVGKYYWLSDESAWVNEPFKVIFIRKFENDRYITISIYSEALAAVNESDFLRELTPQEIEELKNA